MREPARRGGVAARDRRAHVTGRRRRPIGRHDPRTADFTAGRAPPDPVRAGPGGASVVAPSVSFEFFPPKSPEAETTLWRTIGRLAPLRPRFVSVTYGAGGSTRERTHATVDRIHRETPLAVAAHLTCVAASRADVDAVAKRYWAVGIRHVVALRGDMPGGTQGPYVPHPEGYARAVDLIAGLKRVGDFEITAAAYPEVHPEAPDPDFDLDNLKRKIDAGATRAITQFFFEADAFLRFRDRAVRAGITCEIVPGILPITNFAQVVRFASMCGATVPPWLGALFEGLEGDPETGRMVAAAIAAEQCRRLEVQGAASLHFYTLNRPELTRAICHMLGIRPAAPCIAEEP